MSNKSIILSLNEVKNMEEEGFENGKYIIGDSPIVGFVRFLDVETDLAVDVKVQVYAYHQNSENIVEIDAEEYEIFLEDYMEYFVS